MTSLIRWWVIFCSILAAAAFIHFNGLFVALWEHDLSKVSIVTLAMFTLVTLFVGFITHSIHNNHSYKHLRYVPTCWFMSEVLMGMGMAGTLIGFMLMFNSKLASIDPSDVSNVKTVIMQLGYGLTTAVTTTLVGLITSLLVKLQLTSLEQNLDESSFSRDEDDEYEESKKQ